MDRDRLQPSRSAPPDPPQGEQAQPRPFGLADRSGVNPALTPHAENLRSADRPLKVVPAPQSPERLRRELEVTREEIRQLHEMTLELPEIFENKFRQRLRQTLRQQRLLLEENAYLKRRLLELGPATSPRLRPPLLLQPAHTEPAQTESVNPLERQARPGLIQSLRQAWGGLAGGRARATIKGDEPTRDGLADPKHK